MDTLPEHEMYMNVSLMTISDCELNVHKWCVREVEEDCVGAMHKPDKKSRDRISNLFRFSDWQEGKRKPSHLSASHSKFSDPFTCLLSLLEIPVKIPFSFM